MSRCLLVLLVGANAALYTSISIAQQPVTMQTALADYYLCAESFGKRFAKTPERLDDIGEAALAFCAGEREKLFKATLSGASAMNVQEGSSFVAAMDPRVKRQAMKAALEARYPSK